MWGLVLSVLTIAASMVTKKESVEKQGTSSTSSLRVFSFGGSLTRENRIFISGAVLGLGCSLLYRTLNEYFQLNLRFRLFWQSLWLENADDNSKDAPWFESAPIKAARDFLVRTEDGSIRMIVTPKKAATSTLNVTLLTLHPGREIPSTMSVGVEFYYVLAGSGRFSQQGVYSPGNLTVGDCFVVQPRRMRWLSNSKGKEDFVLLRASDDGAQQYSRSQSSSDRIRMDPTQHANPVVRLRDGLRKVHSLANDYVRKNFSGEFRPSE